MRRFKEVCLSTTCKKRCRQCVVVAAVVNNTPFGFLGEHLFWEKVPYMWLLPQLLGIH